MDARGAERPNALVMLTLMCQITDSLAFLHSHDIVHRDLKVTRIWLVLAIMCLNLILVLFQPANILIDSKNKVKITDFGISRLMQNQSWGMTVMRGTPQYMGVCIACAFLLTEGKQFPLLCAFFANC